MSETVSVPTRRPGVVTFVGIVLYIQAVIAAIVGYEGAIVFDQSKPDGVMRKLCSIRKIDGLGWRRQITLQSGLERTIKEYMAR